MIMFSATTSPYISDFPLSKDTTWVAIPINITTLSKSFLSASKTAKNILAETFVTINIPNKSKIKVKLLDYNENFYDLKPSIALEYIKQTLYQVETHNYFIMRFSKEQDFLEQIEYLSDVLDKLYTSLLKYKSDKFVQIEIGYSEMDFKKKK